MGRFTNGGMGQVQFHIAKGLGVFLAALETPRQDQSMKITREVTRCLMKKAF